ALAVLLRLRKALYAWGGRLTLRHLPPRVYEVFEGTKLHTLFYIQSGDWSVRDCGAGVSSDQGRAAWRRRKTAGGNIRGGGDRGGWQSSGEEKTGDATRQRRTKSLARRH